MRESCNRRTFIGAGAAAVGLMGGRPARGRRQRARARRRHRLAQPRNRSRQDVRRKPASRGRGASATSTTRCSRSPSKAVEAATGKAPRAEKDFRRLLDDKSIDAVTIATPDHWHALLTVLACQAGKDVYVEKPASHNVVEGRRMVEAARKYERVVQLGTQRRSTPHVQEAIEHRQVGGHRQGLHGQDLVPSEASEHRPRACGRRSPGRRLCDVAGARARSSVLLEPTSLQLALVLALGHRRAGKQRHPRRRCRPLGPGRGCAASPSARRAESSSSTTTRKRPTRRLPPGNFPRPA